MLKVKRALISVSDKAGILDFARGLQSLGVEILSTGGTAKLLQNNGIKVKEVSEHTGFPEMLDGRVKTLHPMIHGGLLALRDNPEHMEQLKRHNIGLIDLVAVNLYPFDKVTQKPSVTLEDALENIDIGGPSMLRSAAKNFKSVAVICNPKRYKDILKELQDNSGLLSDQVLMNLAMEVFQHTSQYDNLIFNFLNKRIKSGVLSDFPKDLILRFTKIQDLRYGENPHQAGAFYQEQNAHGGLPGIKQLNGKELSFNNLLDLNAALNFLQEFTQPTAVIIKHNNPTGVAQDETLEKAYVQAFKADPLSAFGGIIGLNQKVDLKTAQAIGKSGFMECVVAPAYDESALKFLSAKKNLRVMSINFNEWNTSRFDYKQVEGGLLLQDKDTKDSDIAEWKVVTKLKPTKAQMPALLFGWKIAKHIKSNAVVLIKGNKTVGIGCGQTSRVDSVMAAIHKAGKNAKGAFLVSEAFIPKTDNVTYSAKAGVKIIVQTGGSVADAEVIKEADKKKIVMVMTGIRHFKH